MPVGDKNGSWKGDKVKYHALHEWVRRNKKEKKICACGSVKNIDAANISGEYRRDLSDWKYQCRKCHMTEDGRMKVIEKRHIDTKVWLNCPFCSSRFRVYKGAVNTRKYCSKKCSNKGRMTYEK